MSLSLSIFTLSLFFIRSFSTIFLISNIGMELESETDDSSMDLSELEKLRGHCLQASEKLDALEQLLAEGISGGTLSQKEGKLLTRQRKALLGKYKLLKDLLLSRERRQREKMRLQEKTFFGDLD